MAPKLKGVVDDINTVDEAHRDLYELRDADKKYVLSVEGLEDAPALKNALSRQKQENSTLKTKYKPLEDLEIDAVEVRRLVDVGRDAEEKGVTVDQKVESVKATLKTAHDKKVAQLEGTIHELESNLESVLVDREALDVLSDPKVKGNKTLLLPHIKQQTQIVRLEDGTRVARVMEKKNGKLVERLGPDGEPMTLTALVAELRTKDDFAAAFEGSGASGSGAPPESGGTPPKRNTSRKAEETRDAKVTSGAYSA